MSLLAQVCFHIVTYGLLTRSSSPVARAISQLTFKVVVADESHMAKNKDAQRTVALMAVLDKATRRILLSGALLSKCNGS